MACCHASIVIVSRLCPTAEHCTTVTGTAAVTMTAKGLSSSVPCTQTCWRTASVAVGALGMVRVVSASWLPATPPFALMSSTTAFATLVGSPISGARCCSVRNERSAVMSEIRTASCGAAVLGVAPVDAFLSDDELVHAATVTEHKATTATKRTKRCTRKPLPLEPLRHYPWFRGRMQRALVGAAGRGPDGPLGRHRRGLGIRTGAPQRPREVLAVSVGQGTGTG